MSATKTAPNGTELARRHASEIRGKTVLVTGVSPGGLGAGFLNAIAPNGPRLLILAGRTQAKLAQTAADLRASHPNVATRTLVLDLASQKQVRAAAKEVLAYAEPIDVLVNNAGIMAVPYGTTEDGLEMQFGANHIGHFLFTNLIMSKILASPSGGRIVNVSSDGYRLSPVRFTDLGFDGGKSYDRLRAYGQAKSANMLFSVELARRLGSKGLVSASVHPGVVGTKLADNAALDLEQFFADLINHHKAQGTLEGLGSIELLDVDTGARTHVFAAFDPALKDHNGSFCQEGAVAPPETVRSWGRDPVEAKMLWDASEKLVGETFAY